MFIITRIGNPEVLQRVTRKGVGPSRSVHRRSHDARGEYLGIADEHIHSTLEVDYRKNKLMSIRVEISMLILISSLYTVPLVQNKKRNATRRAPSGNSLCSHEPQTNNPQPAIAASPTADQLLIYPLQLYTSHPSLLFSSSSSSLFPQQYQLYFISLLLVFFIPHFFLFYTSIA